LVQVDHRQVVDNVVAKVVIPLLLESLRLEAKELVIPILDLVAQVVAFQMPTAVVLVAQVVTVTKEVFQTLAETTVVVVQVVIQAMVAVVPTLTQIIKLLAQVVQVVVVPMAVPENVVAEVVVVQDCLA
jgi:hypothetical protein